MPQKSNTVISEIRSRSMSQSYSNHRVDEHMRAKSYCKADL